MVLFYATAHSGCALLKTGRRRGTCTPASWDPGDKFSPLEILAAFRTSRYPAPEKYFFTGTPDYQNIDRLPNYFEPDTCCVGSTRVHLTVLANASPAPLTPTPFFARYSGDTQFPKVPEYHVVISLKAAVFFVGDLCSAVKRRKQKLSAVKRRKQYPKCTGCMFSKKTFLKRIPVLHKNAAPAPRTRTRTLLLRIMKNYRASTRYLE